MKKIIVLGGSGFIGSCLSDQLAKTGRYKVIIIDLVKKKKLIKNQIFFKVNLLQNYQSIFKDVDYVFNFAALADLDEAKNKPLKTAEVNVLGTVNALLFSKKNLIKKFIHASSIYATSEQGGFYGVSKRAAEDYVEKFYKKYKLNFTILRFGSIYGNGGDASNGVNKIIDFAIKKKQLKYKGSKNAARRYIHVEDACKVCVEVMKKKYDNKYLTITGKKRIKVTKLMSALSIIIKIHNKKIIYENLAQDGHYVTKPKKFKFKKGKNLFLKSKYQNFEQKLNELYFERKKLI